MVLRVELEKWWACTTLTLKPPFLTSCVVLLASSYSAHQDHARERHFLFAASIGENFLPLRGHEGVHSQREVASMLLADGRARVVDVLFAGLVVHHQLGVLRRRRAQARHCISAAP